MIVLLETVHPDAEAILRAVDDVVLAPSPTELPDVDPSTVRALLTRGRGRVTAEVIESLPALRVVARCGAGLDNIDVDAADRRGVSVVSAPGVTTDAVAEHATLLMLASARRLTVLAGAVAAGRWDVRDGYEATELRGRRLGVLGLGRIGHRVAEIGRALGMDVVGWTRRAADAAVPTMPLTEVMATSDVLQLCLSLGPGTERLVDDAALAHVGPGALLVNTGRGALVDHRAVGRALDDGRLAAYAADVWDPEPPPPDDPLVGHPRVLVTPHVAAFTDTTYRRLCVGPATAVADVLRRERADAVASTPSIDPRDPGSDPSDPATPPDRSARFRSHDLPGGRAAGPVTPSPDGLGRDVHDQHVEE